MPNHDKRYLEIAEVWAKCSHSKRLQVGAVVVKDDTIIADGYNGTPRGFSNVCENEDGTSKKTVLHAEANAITKIAKSTNSSIGATLYTLVSPCLDCAKLIIQSGIIRVVYAKDYRLFEGVELLKEAGIKVDKIAF